MPSEWRFAEVHKLLMANGFVLIRIRGSHHVYRKAGERPMIVPVHRGRVEYVYVREIQKRIEGN